MLWAVQSLSGARRSGPNIADGFSNLTHGIPNIVVRPQVRSRRKHHVMSQLMYSYNTSSRHLIALGRKGLSCFWATVIALVGVCMSRPLIRMSPKSTYSNSWYRPKQDGFRRYEYLNSQGFSFYQNSRIIVFNHNISTTLLSTFYLVETQIW